MRALLICGLVATLLPRAEATTLQQLSMDDMIRKSTLIVRGAVQHTYASNRGGIIYTHFNVLVTEQWKGGKATQLDFAVPGGSINGMHQSFAGAPTFTDGKQYVLFLWTSRSGLTQVIGLSQGLFVVVPDGSADPMVSRPAILDHMLDANGRDANDSGVQMRLSEMRNRVQSVLAGRSGP